jgi:hypothetical protein
METFENTRIKWPYVTHMVDREQVAGLLPPMAETNPGSLVLVRVLSIGKHKDLESINGTKISLFVGDVFVGALGNRYATDQFEGVGRCSGTQGHIIGIGGVCGEVVSTNNRMPEPTVIEYLGRLADHNGNPLHLSQFHLGVEATPKSDRARTILSLGASMNAGKTTTAAQMIKSLSAAGHRVVAAKLTGTACRKDPNFLYDAGALAVLDFTYTGWPSTADCSLPELLAITAEIRGALAEYEPDFVIYEIADGIVQRETAMMLSDSSFRAQIDGVTFAGCDALSCEAGVRRLQGLGYTVLGTAGMVANSPLGIAEVEASCGVKCYDGASILAGALLPALTTVTKKTPLVAATREDGGNGVRRVLAHPLRTTRPFDASLGSDSTAMDVRQATR